MERMSRLHNVPKRVLVRSAYLHSYRHESTWKLFRSWWWCELYSSSWQCSFKMKHMQNGRTASIERSVERKEINDINIIWTNLGLACPRARKFYEDWMPHGWGTRQLCNISGGRNSYVRLTIVPILFDQLSSTLSVFFPGMSSAKVLLPGTVDKWPLNPLITEHMQ